jgi:phosphatidylserine decarboxylase
MAEVGATMVGSIVQTYKGNSVIKGKEKGYFEFGGSTVVLLFERNKICIDRDLLINTANGYETAVKMGERIGEASPAQSFVGSGIKGGSQLTVD